jgi:hypothetical protein
MALAASDKAITKAEVTTEKRFEGVNEFRAALSDQSATLLPRSEYAVQHKAVVDQVNILSDIVTKMTGRGEGMGTLGTILIGAMVGLNSLVALAALAFAVVRH